MFQKSHSSSTFKSKIKIKLDELFKDLQLDEDDVISVLSEVSKGSSFQRGNKLNKKQKIKRKNRIAYPSASGGI